MREILEQSLAKVPGVVFGLSRNGVRSFQALGHRQVAGVNEPLPMTVDTFFDLASITKVVATTSALMSLYEQGEFSLDDKVFNFLPEWKSSEKAEISVRDLLLHRSGLWEWRPLYIADQNPKTAQNRIANIPLRYPINAGRHYSDLGFISLGEIITSITSESLSESVNRLVLSPLKLSATSFDHPRGREIAATSRGDSIEMKMVETKTPYPVEEQVSDFAGWRKHVLVGEVNDGNAFHLFAGISSHAGLFSNAQDLLTYGEALLASIAGGGHFAPSVIKTFTADGPDAEQSLGFRGWADTFRGCTISLFGHTGFTGTLLAISPAHHFVATFLTNRIHGEFNSIPMDELWAPVLKALHAQIHA